MKTFTILAAALALLVLRAHAITTSGTNPGNVFVAGEPIALAASGVREAVTYQVTGYFGSRVAHGKTAAVGGTAIIQLAGEEPGWYQITCREGSESAKAPSRTIASSPVSFPRRNRTASP